jgi:hypothetical protein
VPSHAACAKVTRISILSPRADTWIASALATGHNET